VTAAYCSACICLDCQKAYVSQTGRQLRVRYKAHIHRIRLNRDDSKFALRILKNWHSYRSIEQTVTKVDQVEKVWGHEHEVKFTCLPSAQLSSVSGRGRDFSLFHSIWTGFGTHPASCPVGAADFSPG
jgi:hypothetical protein